MYFPYSLVHFSTHILLLRAWYFYLIIEIFLKKSFTGCIKSIKITKKFIMNAINYFPIFFILLRIRDPKILQDFIFSNNTEKLSEVQVFNSKLHFQLIELKLIMLQMLHLLLVFIFYSLHFFIPTAYAVKGSFKFENIFFIRKKVARTK